MSLYTITHEPEERVHGFDVVNDPVPDVVVIVTVPVGLIPVTVEVQMVVPPTAKVGQETTVPDVAVVTVTVVVPLPPALFESPEYVAVIVGIPAEVSLYVTPHDPEASVHGFEVVNDPVPDDVVNVTVPVGFVPVTVEVQVVVAPAENEGQETLTVGVALLTVTNVDP